MHLRAPRRLLAAALIAACATAAHAETPALMVVTSDPQYPWTDATDQGGDTDVTLAAALVHEQYRSIASFRQAHPDQAIPVIINGDMTSHGQPHERAFMANALPRLGDTDNVFFGLGNHDYQNNLSNDRVCDLIGCAMGSLDFLSDHVREHRARNQILGEDRRNYGDGWSTTREGSWSYGFVADGWKRVVNVQLNNSPTYRAELTWPRFTYNVQSSIPWLAEKLKEWDDPKTSDFVLLHTHKPHSWTHETLEGLSEFVELLGKHRVKAVFAGHFHRDMGVDYYPSNWGFIPVFISGSASQRTYLIVEHWPESRRLKVYGVRHNDWQAKELLKEIEL